MSEPRRLPDGAVVRTARPEQLDAVAELLTDRGEAADAVDLRLVVASEGPDGVGVVERDGQVVATATLLDEVLHVGTTALPAGQVELVATHRDHEQRGYVRALMDWCHERSAARGHVVQVMIGIPYFYRRFGYVYAIPMHPYAPSTVPPGGRVGGGTGVAVRRAGAADIPTLARLNDEAQAAFDVRMPHQRACWSWLVARGGSSEWLAERDGTAVASARWTPAEDGTVRVGELTSVDDEATAALLAAAAAEPGAGEVLVMDRPGVTGLAARLGPRERSDWYYVRIASIPALLEALRPELSRRLAASPLAAESGTALVSCWVSHVTFDWGPGGVGEVVPGGPFQAPISRGGSGLPPDAVAALVFGCGAAGLEARFPDAYLGRQRRLMEALFPPQRADLLTFYLP